VDKEKMIMPKVLRKESNAAADYSNTYYEGALAKKINRE